MTNGKNQKPTIERGPSYYHELQSVLQADDNLGSSSTQLRRVATADTSHDVRLAFHCYH